MLITAAAALYRKRGGFLYRSAAAVVWLLIIAAYGMAASLILPLIGQRKLINWTVARLYYYCAGYFTAISATVENENYLDSDSPAVYICNHQSSLDVLLMARVFPKATSVVAKKSIKYYPILGWYMSLSQAIFLDRSNRNSAVASAKKAADDIHRKQTSVWIFPEGTRGHPREIDMLPFKKGAFHMAVQAGVPIVPIVIANYNHLYDSKSKRFETGVIPIKVLAPISTTGLKESSDAVDKLTTETRELMLTALREISTITPSKKSD
ncbi:1-acylglycerol-3-phosphate O-acyltransferase [Umbelopsis sp. WA50703]